MIPAAMSRRAVELADQGRPFVTATVVRAQRPTSVEAGDVALVLEDGSIEGFVGGSCAEHSVRAYSLRAIESGAAVLLRILPPFLPEVGPVLPEVGFGPEEISPEGREVDSEEGAVTVENPCLSGGAIEVFLEPSVPAPRVLVVGDTPIAAALLRLGPELGLDTAAVENEPVAPRPGDLALVVAAHGRDELAALRAGLEAELPYVGLVASAKRGDGVIGELRGDGVPGELLARIDVPAGLDIAARTPPEIALSILATVIEVRRRTPGSEGPVTAVDPVCGMTVAAVAATPSVGQDGETVYFCCEGCKTAFESEHRHAAAD